MLVDEYKNRKKWKNQGNCYILKNNVRKYQRYPQNDLRAKQMTPHTGCESSRCAYVVTKVTGKKSGNEP